MFLKIDPIAFDDNGKPTQNEVVIRCDNCRYVEGNVYPASSQEMPDVLPLYNGLLQYQGWMLTVESEEDLSDPEKVGHICPKCAEKVKEKRKEDE